jgi:hypothetical protein
MARRDNPSQKEQPPLYPAKHFTGKVSYMQHSTECGFTAEIGRNGSINVVVDRVPIRGDKEFLLEARSVGTKFPLFLLEGKSEDGDRLSSSALIFTDPQTVQAVAGSYFCYRGSCSTSKLLARKQNKEELSGVTYFLRGFRTFRPLRFRTSNCSSPG